MSEGWVAPEMRSLHDPGKGKP